ncbi:MAG: hypothetical protein J6Z43_05445 [Clostridiales bacterium]|nr:hypothetical protein [Clostridiales bacterium]
MISIRDIIASSVTNTRASQEILRDEHVAQVYKECPDLAEVDKEIIATRANRLIAAIDNNTVEQRHSESLMDQLTEKRTRIMARFDIAPDFDELKPLCTRCGDTGYFTNKKGMKQVCPCRRDDIEECYRLSGMGDYTLVKLDNYKDDHFGKASHRAALRKKLSEIIIDKDKAEEHPLWVLSDGVQTGKTFLAIYSLKLAVNLAKSVYYLRLDDLLNKYDEDLEDAKDCDILVVDDYIAAMTMTGMVGTRLNAILETRQAMGLVTVIVTSFEMSSLISESDVRIAGKLKKAGKIA